MLIFIQRGTSVPFFLRFFRGFAPFRHFGTAKDSRFGCGRVTADSSGLPLWCGERLLRQGILTVLSLYSSVECAGVKRISLLQPKKKKRSQNEIGRAILPLWCGERLLRQGILTVLSLYSSVECAGVKRIFFVAAKKKKRSQNEIGRAFLPLLCGERLLRQGGFWLCPNDNGGGGDSCLRCRRKPYI